VLMAGAGATLLAQWGLIPILNMGPRASVLAGMALALVGTIALAFASDLHAIALSFAVASLGFGLYRPGFTAGASLAVTRAEQGQVGGIVASLNGAAYIVAPALGVWLYNHHEAIGFATIGGLCAGLFGWGWRAFERDARLAPDGQLS
jgi:MFS family permease